MIIAIAMISAVLVVLFFAAAIAGGKAHDRQNRRTAAKLKNREKQGAIQDDDGRP